MTALFAGLTTVDVLHGLDHTPSPTIKATSTDFLLAAGGPATNAAATYAALESVICPADDATAPHPSTYLLTALGMGALSSLIHNDLKQCGVEVLDATATNEHSESPAISSIIDHPTGRMVASTNATVPIETRQARVHLSHLTHESIDAVLVDGHNPELADLALRLGTSHFPEDSDTGETDPFAELEDKPAHLRILDGGSWKPWLTPLLGFIDIAVISADFLPPLLREDNPEAIADFLRGFGIQHIIRTNGPDAVQWWWKDASGTVQVPQVNAISTLGAGDIFHGAFTWATAYAHRNGGVGQDPSELIEFANRIASLSVTYFGTRSWREDPAVASAVQDFIHHRGIRP